MNLPVVNRLGLMVFALISSVPITKEVVQAPESQQLDEKREPPLEFVLDHDGTKTPLVLEQATEIRTTQGAVTVTLHMKASRTLRLMGVCFDYPAAFSFSFNGSDATSPAWTLSHDETVIRLARFPNAAEPAKAAMSLVTSLEDDNGGDKERPRATKLVTKGMALEGYKGKSGEGDETVSLEAYGFKANGIVYVLLVQDGPNDDGKESRDHAEVIKLLTSTFRLEKTPGK